MLGWSYQHESENVDGVGTSSGCITKNRKRSGVEWSGEERRGEERKRKRKREERLTWQSLNLHYTLFSKYFCFSCDFFRPLLGITRTTEGNWKLKRAQRTTCG